LIKRSACGDFAAGIACAVRLGGRTLGAIERFGEDARRGGLADAAHAGENIRVRDAVRLNRVRKRPRHVLLADNLSKRLRAIFSGDDFVAHSILSCASRLRSAGGDERNFG
jgi:hypothetical protein